MIDPKELSKQLRIGNLVESEYDGIVEVGVRLLERILDQAEVCKPILITEEWLIKLGFKIDNNGYCLEDKYSLSIAVTKDGEYLPCWNDRVLDTSFKIKYIHQLQNLYFSLVGKEPTFQ